MEGQQFTQLERALMILEKYLGAIDTDSAYVPDHLKERAETCLARLSSNTAKLKSPSAISTSGRSRTELLSGPQAALVPQSIVPAGTSKRRADDVPHGKGKLHQKRNKTTGLSADEAVQRCFKALKVRGEEVKELTKPDTLALILGGSLANIGHDPREADTARATGLRRTLYDRVRGLVAIRSLYQDLRRRKERGLQPKSIKELLAAKFEIEEKVIRTANVYGAKSQEIVKEFGSPGMLWFLALELNQWRYLASEGVFRLVKRIKEDTDMSNLAESSASAWLVCEKDYEEFIVHHIELRHMASALVQDGYTKQIEEGGLDTINYLSNSWVSPTAHGGTASTLQASDCPINLRCPSYEGGEGLLASQNVLDFPHYGNRDTIVSSHTFWSS